jgi:hypothetical protein
MTSPGRQNKVRRRTSACSKKAGPLADRLFSVSNLLVQIVFSLIGCNKIDILLFDVI